MSPACCISMSRAGGRACFENFGTQTRFDVKMFRALCSTSHLGGMISKASLRLSSRLPQRKTVCSIPMKVEMLKLMSTATSPTVTHEGVFIVSECVSVAISLEAQKLFGGA